MSKAPPRLTTASLVLRCFAPADAAAIRALNGEESTRRWLPSHVYDSDDEASAAVDYLARSCESPGDPRLGPFVLAVELMRTGELIGHVGFSLLESDVEISYAIAERHRRSGLASEAVEAACRWVCKQFSLERVIAVTDVENAASRRMLARCGFAHVGDRAMTFQGAERRVGVYAFVPESAARLS